MPTTSWTAEIIDEFPFPSVPARRQTGVGDHGWLAVRHLRRPELGGPAGACRKYVEYVEQAIGCHITYVSVGPERDSIIIR